MSDFETWFEQFRAQHRGWEADQYKPWLKAAWDAATAAASGVSPATVVWASDAGISASEFMALSANRRREILDRFYERLHEEQS